MSKLMIVLIILGLSVIDIQAVELEIVAEDYPPFEYEEEGKMKGFTVELIQAILSKTAHQGKTQLYPWARAELMSLQKENVLIHTLTRSAKRENLYKWVGPLAPREMYYFKLKERKDIHINTLEDAKNYRTIAIIGHSVTKYLLSKGFEMGKNIYSVTSDKQRIKMLFLGHADLICIIEPILYWRLKQSGIDRAKFEKVFLIDGSKQYYMAFSKQTSDTIVNQFREVFNVIRNDGTFEKIKAKYF